MKRLIALLLTAVFSITLFAPPAISTPYDPLQPREDNREWTDDTPDESDPWGELHLTGGYESIGFSDISLWWEATKFMVGAYLLGWKFEPTVIIVRKQTVDNNQGNGTTDEDQSTNNTNTGTGTQIPSGK
ncbi:MAG: hypothetical protein JXA92_09500 [candidate division Zixibacteria bacterium]|nr:hypothetical protein [candidate division Zixibacteria bacterium]